MKIVQWSMLTGKKHIREIPDEDILSDNLSDTDREYIEEGNLPEDYDQLADREKEDLFY